MKKYPLYVVYEEDCAEVIEDTYGDDGPYAGFTHDRYDYEVTGVYSTKPDSTVYYEERVLDSKNQPEEVYVVIVRYSTGSTFGHSDGRGHIVGVYESEEKAKEVSEKINTGKFKGKYGYTPWTGYFERLEGVEIDCFDIKEKEGKARKKFSR